ncbi:MAG: hypothetical protein ACJ8AW_46825 [Rhodopila sp.]|jgi:hypothetical protein
MLHLRARGFAPLIRLAKESSWINVLAKRRKPIEPEVLGGMCKPLSKVSGKGSAAGIQPII